MPRNCKAPSDGVGSAGGAGAAATGFIFVYPNSCAMSSGSEPSNKIAKKLRKADEIRDKRNPLPTQHNNRSPIKTDTSASPARLTRIVCSLYGLGPSGVRRAFGGFDRGAPGLRNGLKFAGELTDKKALVNFSLAGFV
jgi:hypothetical protein